MCGSARPVITGNAANLIRGSSHATCYSKLKRGVGEMTRKVGEESGASFHKVISLPVTNAANEHAQESKRGEERPSRALQWKLILRTFFTSQKKK